MISLASCSRFAWFCTKGGDRAASCWNVSMAEGRRLIWTAGIDWISPRIHPASDASGNADRGIDQKNCFSSIIPPMRHVMSADVSRHALSRYALHQGTLSPRGPSPPGDLLPQGTFSPRGPSLALRQFTLSSPLAIHSPCEYTLVCSTAAAMRQRVWKEYVV